MGVDYLFRAHENDAGTVVESFNDEEAEILQKYVTDVSGNVFAWRLSDNITPEQAGAMLSRYSRTSLTGKRLFVKEFYPNKDRGREFFDAWLVDYGDDSIQEMVGGLPTACEFVSNLAVKDIEDCRMGSYIEKSTRYVPFDKKLPNNEYMYYRDPEILSSKHADDYIKLMDGLFNSYSSHMEKMSNYIKETNPIENIDFKLGDRTAKVTELKNGIDEATGVSEEDLTKAYNNAIRANALDFLRDYLPMSTLTHVGISMDARSYENMLNKMLSSPLSESRWISKRLILELKKIVPSLVKRIGEQHGAAMQGFMTERNSASEEIVNSLTSGIASKGDSVNLYDFAGKGGANPDMAAQMSISSAIIYRFSHGISMKDAVAKAESIGETGRKNLISKYVGKRANRRHKPGRAFENTEYAFDLMGRIGIYRDIQRHRIGTQERQNFGTELGYETREAYDMVGITDDYKSKMQEVKDLYAKLMEKMPYQAQYAVTFGFNIRWYYRINARQLYHLCELRSSQQGHPDYRKLVQQMAMEVKAVHPSVTEHMRYLDMSEKTLGRLDSEIRIAVKRNAAKS